MQHSTTTHALSTLATCAQVSDAQALRVTVDDEGGGKLQHSTTTHKHFTLATCAQVFDARALRVIVDDEGGG